MITALQFKTIRAMKKARLKMPLIPGHVYIAKSHRPLVLSLLDKGDLLEIRKMAKATKSTVYMKPGTYMENSVIIKAVKTLNPSEKTPNKGNIIELCQDGHLIKDLFINAIQKWLK